VTIAIPRELRDIQTLSIKEYRLATKIPLRHY